MEPDLELMISGVQVWQKREGEDGLSIYTTHTVWRAIAGLRFDDLKTDVRRASVKLFLLQCVGSAVSFGGKCD